MGLIDSFSAEDRVSVKFSDFYNLMKEAAKAEVMIELARKADSNRKAGKMIKALVEEEYDG